MTELPEREPANLLAIYDLSLDGQHDAQSVREAKDCENLAGALQDLPDQGECCRLYIAGYLAQQGQLTLERHLREILPLYSTYSRAGFDSLSTQWSKTKPSLRHALKLITVGTEHLPAEVTCSIGCYRAVDNALVVVISINDTENFIFAGAFYQDECLYTTQDYRRLCRKVFDRYINVFLEENQEHRHCQCINHSPELRFKVYALQFYRTALGLFDDFSAQVNPDNIRLDHSFSYSDSRTLAWEKAVKIASNHSSFVETAISMSIVAKSLVSFVRASCTEELTPQIKCLLAEVDSLSDGIASPFTRLADRFSRRMDVMNTSRNIQDSRDSRLLNLLACIFLPASLATSLLSMSTRFSDLGPLLYDFCGVVVLFASFLAFIFSSLKLYQWTKEKLATQASGKITGKRHIKWRGVHLWKLPLLLLLVIVWPIVLSSFIVGMVVDVSLGSRILAYGAVAAIGVLLIVTVGIWRVS